MSNRPSSPVTRRRILAAAPALCLARPARAQWWPFMQGAASTGPFGPIIADGTMQWAVAASATIASGGTTLTTTLTNNLIIAAIESSRGSAVCATVSSVTSTSGLSFTRLGGLPSPISSGTKNVNIEVWTAFSPGVLVAEEITFNLAGVVTCNSCGTLAINGITNGLGAYTLDGAVLTNAAADSGHPAVTMTTTHANDIIIWAAGGVFINSNVATPTGFTIDAQINSSSGLFSGSLGLSHKIVAATQTGLVLEPASGTGLGVCLAAAFKGSGA